MVGRRWRTAGLKSWLALSSEAAQRVHPHKTLMITEKIDNITVQTQANVYFGGQCISHGIVLADGTKKSVGVILPGRLTLTFNTGAAETMECVGGACEYMLAGTDAWVRSSAGERFSVPGNSTFDIRVAEGLDAYHYICHFA